MAALRSIVMLGAFGYAERAFFRMGVMGFRGWPQSTTIVAMFAVIASSATRAPAQPMPSPSAPAAAAWLSVLRDATSQSCADRERLERAVRERLQVVGEPLQSGLSAHVTFSLDEVSGFRALIELNESGAAAGSRVLHGTKASCDELSQAVAVAIALALDLRFSAGPSPESEPVVEAPLAISRPVKPLPSPGKEARSPHVAVAVREEPWRARFGVRLGAALAAGLLPESALGCNVGFALRPWRRLGVDASAWLFPLEAQSPLPGGRAGVGFRAASVDLRGCATLLELPAAGLLGCAGFSLGALRYGAYGTLRSNGAATQATANLVVNLAVRARLARAWSGYLGVGSAVPLIRDEFVYSALDGTDQQLFRVSAMAGVFELGLEYWPRGE